MVALGRRERDCRSDQRTQIRAYPRACSQQARDVAFLSLANRQHEPPHTTRRRPAHASSTGHSSCRVRYLQTQRSALSGRRGSEWRTRRTVWATILRCESPAVRKTIAFPRDPAPAGSELLNLDTLPPPRLGDFSTGCFATDWD